MKKKLSKLFGLLLVSLYLSACGGNNPTPSDSGESTPTDSGEVSTDSGESTTQEDTSSTSEDVEDYYVSIHNETGSELLTALNTLNNQKKTKSFKYADIKEYSKYTERPATGDDVPADKMVGFYDNTLVSAEWDSQATWNREHVWPNSLGGGKVEGDLFMTRPCSVKINSERGNKFYGIGEGLYDAGQYVAEYRGVAARIIFYCAIAQTSLKLGEESASNTMGKLSDLLRWNLEYLPSTAEDAPLALRVEQNRNDVVQKQQSPQLQGNRNPFVDHPEYACRIWGDRNSETRKACGIN